MFTFSPQDKQNYLKLPHSKVWEPLVLNTVCGYLDDPRLFVCFVMVAHESLVCSEQLN